MWAHTFIAQSGRKSRRLQYTKGFLTPFFDNVFMDVAILSVVALHGWKGVGMDLTSIPTKDLLRSMWTFVSSARIAFTRSAIPSFDPVCVSAGFVSACAAILAAYLVFAFAIARVMNALMPPDETPEINAKREEQ
jgi:hypothetical protein